MIKVSSRNDAPHCNIAETPAATLPISRSFTDIAGFERKQSWAGVFEIGSDEIPPLSCGFGGARKFRKEVEIGHKTGTDIFHGNFQSLG